MLNTKKLASSINSIDYLSELIRSSSARHCLYISSSISSSCLCAAAHLTLRRSACLIICMRISSNDFSTGGNRRSFSDLDMLMMKHSQHNSKKHRNHLSMFRPFEQLLQIHFEVFRIFANRFFDCKMISNSLHIDNSFIKWSRLWWQFISICTCESD